MASDFNTTDIDSTTVATESPLDHLCFTARHPDGRINLWAPATVQGDWDAECRAGRQRGREAIEYIRQSGNAALLGGIVRSIAERGSLGGVEVGFFAALSLELAAV